ncbi:MAG: S9 family peptidase [Opitutaceae bacterium]
MTALPTVAQLALDASQPPITVKKPKDVTVHGDRRIDNYFWLREKENPAVRKHLEEENTYTDAVMAPTKLLQEKLYTEMLGRIKETDSAPPVLHRGYWYYTRTEQGKQYPVYARRTGTIDSPEQITLDVNLLAAGHPYMAVGAYKISDDSQLLAYTIDSTGYRQYSLFLKNLSTSETRALGVERITSLEWSKNHQALFFTQEDAISKRSYRLGRLELKSGTISWVYEEKDELFDLSLSRSRDGTWLFATSESKTTTEIRALYAATPNIDWRIIANRRNDIETRADYRDGLFYFRTNDHAKNFRIVSAPVTTPEPDHWVEYVPHQADVKLDDFDLFATHTVLSERENGLPHLRVIDDRSHSSHRITTPEPVYEISLESNPEPDTEVIRFIYQSLVTPRSIISYQLTTKVRTVLKQQEIPSGYDASRYASERIWARASDGTRVPISLVYRKDLRRSGAQPLYLYAYGSYGVSMPVSFNASRLSLLDRGIIFAIAHIRGGGEFGEPWREAGRMAHKMTTFTDFIACAEHLITEKFTDSNQLVINGGSAGGLLMGAVVNLRPELFHAAIYDVPFVDVLNTMLDASLPLTTSEYIEWGNPNIADEYAWMRAYSPYDNVRAVAHPHILMNVSLNDSQVPYWEGAKLVAKIREMNTGKNALLLHTNLAAGHGGASGRYDALRETAYRFAFALGSLGINEIAIAK